MTNNKNQRNSQIPHCDATVAEGDRPAVRRDRQDSLNSCAFDCIAFLATFRESFVRCLETAVEIPIMVPERATIRDNDFLIFCIDKVIPVFRIGDCKYDSSCIRFIFLRDLQELL